MRYEYIFYLIESLECWLNIKPYYNVPIGCSIINKNKKQT